MIEHIYPLKSSHCLVPALLQKIDACPDETHAHDAKQDKKVGISGIKVEPNPTNAEEQANRPERGIELLLSQPDNLNDDQA